MTTGADGDAADVDIEGPSDESEAGTDTDVGSAGFDEYEWAGQTRVRAHAALSNIIPRWVNELLEGANIININILSKLLSFLL